MRFTPASVLLASLLALSASSVTSAGKKADPAPLTSLAPAAIKPAAINWAERGAQAYEAGDLETARGAYETALLTAPGNADLYYALGKIARAEKLPGKAIKYFNMVLALDPKNELALQGEGIAMMDKGATQSARDTLAKLKTLCKTSCTTAEPLAAAIAAGPPKFVSADATPPSKGDLAERQ